MLDTGRPTRTTGGRSSRGLTGNDPRTVGRRYHLESRVCSEIQGWETRACRRVERKPGPRLVLRHLHRNVCETIGQDQPTRMGDRFWQVSPAVRSGIDVLLGTQSGHFAFRSLRLSFCPGFPSRSCCTKLSTLRALLRLPGPWGGRLGAHRVSSRMRSEQGVLCPGGGKVNNQVLPKAFRF